MTRDYFVSIDDYIGPFRAQTEGRFWNGWECPSFDFDTACAVGLALITHPGAPSFAGYDPERDLFWTIQSDIDSLADVDDEIDEYAGQNGRYPIGAMGWTWDEAEPQHLADSFVRIVEDELTEDELAEVRRRNATPGYARACATHDFRDANEMMAEAFRDYFGRDPDPSREADTAFWNAAWELARWGALTDRGLR